MHRFGIIKNIVSKYQHHPFKLKKVLYIISERIGPFYALKEGRSETRLFYTTPRYEDTGTDEV